MHNFDLILTTQSGESSIVFDDCSEAIAWLAGNGDEETRRISIAVTADDGRTVLITIPNDGSRKVSVQIGPP
ncbi:MAG: hypothetical protein JWQ98_1696 [Chlorobi bacterium]|nr:hypothetical protein [Chlorobiota bacterium]